MVILFCIATSCKILHYHLQHVNYNYLLDNNNALAVLRVPRAGTYNTTNTYKYSLPESFTTYNSYNA